MAKQIKNKILHIETTTTNNNGEVQIKNTQKILVAQEPEYVKLYFNTLLVFKDLPKQMHAVLFQLLRRMTYADPEESHGGQLIVLNQFIKEEIIERLGIKMNTLDQNLTKFVKGGILKRVGYSTYQGNPEMFGRGDWHNIKAIRATFDFNKKTVVADIDRVNTKSPMEMLESNLKEFYEGTDGE